MEDWAPDHPKGAPCFRRSEKAEGPVAGSGESDRGPLGSWHSSSGLGKMGSFPDGICGKMWFCA